MVPSANDKGTLRAGLRTSPAVKVMLFQASAANSEPIWAVHSPIRMPKLDKGEMPAAGGSTPTGVQGWEKLAFTASAFQPSRKPITITPTSVPIFMVVKTFCTPLPYFSPRLLVQVTKATRHSETTWAVDSDRA